MHFAPGLSDNAAFNLPEVPANAYLGMYIDGDGPEGIMRNLPPTRRPTSAILPMYYPYVLKAAPDTFVVQFGGGISTAVALRSGARTSPSPRATRRSSRPSATPSSATSPATSSTIPGSTSSTMTAASTSPTHDGALRRHRPEPRQLGRPVQSRRLRHRREVRLHARGDADLHARPEAAAASCR